jgi:hypothetical protein
MLMMDLADLVQLAKESGFTVGLYPRLDFSTDFSRVVANLKNGMHCGGSNGTRNMSVS